MLLSTGSQFWEKQFQSFNLIPTSCDFTSSEPFIRKPFLPLRARVAVHYCNRRGHFGFTLCLLCIVFRPSRRCWHAAGRPSTDARNAFSSENAPDSELVTSLVSFYGDSAKTASFHLSSLFYFYPPLSESWVLDQVTLTYRVKK